jgi:hypothetical protein
MRYTLQSRKFLSQQVTTDAVAILINAPIYGGTSPNLSQLQALDAITMQDIVRYEIQGTYKRFIFPTLTVTEETVGQQIFAKVEAPITFTTAITNATHICYVFNALVLGATELNFNNRGNTQGTPLLVKPISNSPITIVPPAILQYTFNIRLGSG